MTTNREYRDQLQCDGRELRDGDSAGHGFVSDVLVLVRVSVC